MNEREQRAARWYRTLLLCFPRQFRRDYGSDLTLTFLARWRATHADRPIARWKFWIRTTWDVVLNGVLERWAGLRRQRAQLPVIPAPPARRGSSMDQLLRDLRYAARSVRRATLAGPRRGGTRDRRLSIPGEAAGCRTA